MSNTLAALVLAPSMMFTGQAITEDGTRYQEVHQYNNCDSAQLCETVTYLDENGERFANKQVAYNAPSWQPDFTFTDSRFQLSEQVEVRGDKIYVSRVTPDETLEFVVEQQDNIVFDAGFHPYIQHNFEQLQAGETLEFLFLATTRESPIRFQAKAVAMTTEQMDIQVRINNPLIALFVDDIRLTYRLADKALLSFNGLTNIRRSEGKGNWNAQIIYQY
ncbi:hypothetical protein [Salinibius halmophilus]|uniref:hypothetical protein n=1 Tax=Salinibius halmophilus TaxID=1853216 RepID=UPI000E6744FF|nr:hypothetical protein [Salinibius halmophilus]